MAGINVVFGNDEFIDHGMINESWHGALGPNEHWAWKIRLVEVPLAGEDESLFVVLKEEQSHTELRGLFLGADPRDEDFDRESAPAIGGGYTGGHIREDGKMSLGTPYKAFSRQLAYLGSYQFMLRNAALRVDEVPEDIDTAEDWSKADRLELQRVQHRSYQVRGREVRKEDV